MQLTVYVFSRMRYECFAFIISHLLLQPKLSFSQNTIIYSIIWSLLHVSVTSNHRQADISIHEHDMFSAYNIGNHTVALNMSCPCIEMSAWWWLLVTETCSKLHIIEYIVVFWRNDHFVYTKTQRVGSYKIMCYFYQSVFFSHLERCLSF